MILGRGRDCMLLRSEVPNLTEDERAVDAFGELSATPVERGLVLDDGRLVGLLSIRDLARALEPARRRSR